jgi:hypothetical protein
VSNCKKMYWIKHWKFDFWSIVSMKTNRCQNTPDYYFFFFTCMALFSLQSIKIPILLSQSFYKNCSLWLFVLVISSYVIFYVVTFCPVTFCPICFVKMQNLNCDFSSVTFCLTFCPVTFCLGQKVTMNNFCKMIGPCITKSQFNFMLIFAFKIYSYLILII